MQKRKKMTKKGVARLLAEYGIQLWVIFFLANVALVYAVHFFLIAQTCITPQQIAADQRCLYIWGNQVFQKGSRAAPHQGHPCGTDVTSIIPASHIGNQASYLMPNFVANLCQAVAPTPTTLPTLVPTATPIPTALLTSTPTPPPAVPSPACLGSCPTTNPITPGGGTSVPIPSTQNPGGTPGTNNGGLINQLLNLLQQLINLLINLLSGGGGSGNITTPRDHDK